MCMTGQKKTYTNTHTNSTRGEKKKNKKSIRSLSTRVDCFATHI